MYNPGHHIFSPCKNIPRREWIHGGTLFTMAAALYTMAGSHHKNMHVDPCTLLYSKCAEPGIGRPNVTYLHTLENKLSRFVRWFEMTGNEARHMTFGYIFKTLYGLCVNIIVIIPHLLVFGDLHCLHKSSCDDGWWRFPTKTGFVSWTAGSRTKNTSA